MYAEDGLSKSHTDDEQQSRNAGKRLVFRSRVWREELGRYVYAKEYGKRAFAFYVDVTD